MLFHIAQGPVVNIDIVTQNHASRMYQFFFFNSWAAGRQQLWLGLLRRNDIRLIQMYDRTEDGSAWLRWLPNRPRPARSNNISRCISNWFGLTHMQISAMEIHKRKHITIFVKKIVSETVGDSRDSSESYARPRSRKQKATVSKYNRNIKSRKSAFEH